MASTASRWFGDLLCVEVDVSVVDDPEAIPFDPATARQTLLTRYRSWLAQLADPLNHAWAAFRASDAAKMFIADPLATRSPIVVGGVLALLEPLLPLDLDERLGLSATSIGLVFAAGSAAYLFSAPVMGRFSDRRGRRLPVVAGLVLTALALPFIAVGPVWVPVVAFVVVGIGMGSAIAPSGSSRGRCGTASGPTTSCAAMAARSS